MIQLIASYLVSSEPTHLSSFYIRKGDKTQQFWTHAWVPGPIDGKAGWAYPT